MAEQLSQGSETLKKASEHVDTAKTEVKQKCNALGSDIQNMMAGWGGQGATSFNNLMIVWQEKQDKILTALQQLGESLAATDKDNVATDEAQSAANSSLASRLS